MKSIRLSTSDKLRLWLFNIMSLISLFFLILGMALFIFGNGISGLADLQFSFRSTERVNGYVTEIRYTNVRSNDELVYEFNYTFPVGLTTYYGSSFSSLLQADVDDKVLVEYVKSDPERSRIVGTSSTPGSMAYVGAVMLLIALVILLILWLRSRRIVHILEDGTIISGTLESIEKTNVEVNEKRQYKTNYRYHVDGKSYTTIYRTTEPDDMGKEELLIYSNQDHAEGILVRKLPKSLAKKVKTSLS